MKTYVNFQMEKLLVFKSQLFLIYSFFYVLLNSQKIIHVGEEVIKIVFFLVWMLDNVIYVNQLFFNISKIKS
jgi:hypothetical protein